MIVTRGGILFSYQDAKNALKQEIKEVPAHRIQYGYRRLECLFRRRVEAVDDHGTLYWRLVDFDNKNDRYDLRYCQSKIAKTLLKWYEDEM